MLWSVEHVELLDDHRGLAAVVAVVVGDELAPAIGTQVLAKFKRHEVLHEFGNSLWRFVLHRDEVSTLSLV